MTNKENRLVKSLDIIEHLLQTLFILVLNQVGKITRNMKKRDRNFFLFLSFLLIPIYFLLIYSGKVTDFGLRTQLSRHIVGLILMIPIFIFSVDRDQYYVKWRKTLSVPLIASGILMLIISFVHPIGSGYRVFAMMLIFVFPALSFVWNNRGDYNVLFDSMSNAICIVGLAYFIVCVIGIANGQIDASEPRFKGSLSHAGNLSQVYTSVFCSGLYLIIRHFRIQRIVYFGAIVTGIGVGMLLIGQGRSCMLACIACLIAAIIYFIKNVSKGGGIPATKKILISLAIALIATSLASKIQMLAPKTEDAQTGVVLVVEAHIAQNSDDEQLEESEKEETENSAVRDAIGRFSGEGKDINGFSSGRIDLWKKVIVHLNMWGNDVEKQSIQDITQDSWKIYAHNIFLEIGYRCGIPEGLLFLIVEYVTGCIALWYLFSNINKRRNYLIFSIMMVIVYISQSLLDCASMPFILESGLYFYFAITPMMEGRKDH